MNHFFRPLISVALVLSTGGGFALSSSRDDSISAINHKYRPEAEERHRESKLKESDAELEALRRQSADSKQDSELAPEAIQPAMTEPAPHCDPSQTHFPGEYFSAEMPTELYVFVELEIFCPKDTKIAIADPNSQRVCSTESQGAYRLYHIRAPLDFSQRKFHIYASLSNRNAEGRPVDFRNGHRRTLRYRRGDFKKFAPKAPGHKDENTKQSDPKSQGNTKQNFSYDLQKMLSRIKSEVDGIRTELGGLKESLDSTVELAQVTEKLRAEIKLRTKAEKLEEETQSKLTKAEKLREDAEQQRAKVEEAQRVALIELSRLKTDLTESHQKRQELTQKLTAALAANKMAGKMFVTDDQDRFAYNAAKLKARFKIENNKLTAINYPSSPPPFIHIIYQNPKSDAFEATVLFVISIQGNDKSEVIGITRGFPIMFHHGGAQIVFNGSQVPTDLRHLLENKLKEKMTEAVQAVHVDARLVFPDGTMRGLNQLVTITATNP